MQVERAEQPLSKHSPVAAVFKPPSPHPSKSYESLRRASLSSQISSRRGSNNSRRRRIDANRRSDASSMTTERRTSLPTLSFKPVEHPPGVQAPPVQLPNVNPEIYAQLSSFTFGAPPSTPSSQNRPPVAQIYSGHVSMGTDQQNSTSSHSRSQSVEDTDMSASEVDEEEQARADRSKMRAIDDGSRRPSLPINIPPGSERRRSSLLRTANSMDAMQIDETPEDTANGSSSLPARLTPKPLPALPLLFTHSQTSSTTQSKKSLHSQLAASAAAGGYDLNFIMDQDSNPGSPKFHSDASDAASPPRRLVELGEPSSSQSARDAAQYQAVLDHEWGTAFTFPGNISPRSSIEDSFMRLVDQFDPVYNRNRYAWTFKKIANTREKKHRPPTTTQPSTSVDPLSTEASVDKGKAPEKPENEQPQVIMWNCQNVGQYGVWPGRSASSGEHRRPSVLYGVAHEGGKRRGPTYLIHKHSRCHAFSVFQGYQVTGQKILASHAMLLANKAIQYSFANSPDTRSKSNRPHEPYEDDPEVMKLQTHNLVDDDDELQYSRTRRSRGHTVHASSTQSASHPASHTSSVPDRLSSSRTIDPTKVPLRTGPSSFAATEVDKSQLSAYLDTEDSATSNSTISPAPRVTPHAVAFDSIDPTMADNALNRASSTRFEWFRRAFGTGRAVGTAPRFSGQGNGPPSASLDGTYSPPWLLMAPQSVRQEEERIIQNLNDSFRAVGLIPPPRLKTTAPETRPKRPKPKPSLLDSIPKEAMLMLMPLWIAEGGTHSGVSKHHVPMSERTYLLVYYVPFDLNSKSEESGASTPSKKRTRRDRDRTGDRKRSAVGRSNLSYDRKGDYDDNISPLTPEVTHKRPKKCSFRVVARILNYSDVREIGIKLPRFGLAVHGALSDAFLGNPSYHAYGENFSAVVAVCHGGDSGVELVTEGLDKLGLRKHRTASAEEQQVALAAMEMDPGAMTEELNARQEPLTPIGKSIVEMIFAGCISILDVGFR